MSNILIGYGTHHGQTAAIARRIAEILEGHGHDVDLRNQDTLDVSMSLEPYDAVILGSSVHIGRHHAVIEHFAKARHDELERLHTGFFSVSLSAAGGEKQRDEAHGVLIDFEHRTGWTPSDTVEVAGALKYTAYNFVVRFVMQQISRANHSDTDTSRDWEYTDWAAVEAFANRFLTGERGLPRSDGETAAP